MFSFKTVDTLYFGRNITKDIAPLIGSLGKRVCVVTGANSERQAQLVNAITSLFEYAESIHCTSEPTIEKLEQGVLAGKKSKIDCVIAIGGGAAIDSAKALAALITNEGKVIDYLEVIGDARPLDNDPLPFVAIPTTAGTGAEVTKNAVITSNDHRRKVSMRDNRMYADVAIVDPALTDDTPIEITLACGLDAITQVIEPAISRKANPLTDAMACHAIPLGLKALLSLSEKESKTARDDMAFVSLSGGLCLANSGLGVVHGIAGVLGGLTNQAHGIICGRLLGPALVENMNVMQRQTISTGRMECVAEKLAEVFRVSNEDAFMAFGNWINQTPLPPLDLQGVDIEYVAIETQRSSSMKGNPVDLSVAQICTIIEAAAPQSLSSLAR